MPKPSPQVTPALAFDEGALKRMMSQSLEDAEKESLAASASSSNKLAESSHLTQELPPGRGRRLLAQQLRGVMVEKQRQRHEFRCEDFEMQQKEYNEKMGIDPNDVDGQAESDEDFEPAEG